MDYVKSLYELCETLSREIEKANGKIRKANGELTAGDIEYIDKLTHSLKSVKATIAMIESEEGGSYDGYSNRRRYSREGRSYRRSYDGSYEGSYDGSYDGDTMYDDNAHDGSYARGRYAKRDSMGRYARDGYSRHANMVEELKDLMKDAPDDRTRKEMERLVQKMENM